MLLLLVAEIEQINQAVDAAEKAFYGGWKRSNPQTRARLMHKLADLIERDAQDLAYLETLDNGKPLRDARGDVVAVVNQL